tara:strand:- start:240 stop:1958 length:1719 start_codon:yes stop_codon:yes gene_type:complete
MGEDSPVSPIIIKKSSTRKCTLLCDLVFNYVPNGYKLKSLLKNENGELITNYDPQTSHLEIEPIPEKDTEYDVSLNGVKYKLLHFTLFTTPVHEFSEDKLKKNQGEIVLLHRNIKKETDYLQLCIPVSKTSGFSKSFDFFQEWIPMMPMYIDSYDDRIINVSETWSFMNLIPANKSFYLYSGTPILNSSNFTGTLNCIVINDAASIGSEDFERMANINGQLQQPNAAVEPPSGIYVYYNDGLNIKDNKTIGEVDVVCEEVEKEEDHKPKKPTHYTPPNILQMLLVFLLFLFVLGIMRGPESKYSLKHFMTFVILAAVLIIYSAFSLAIWLVFAVLSILPLLIYFIYFIAFVKSNTDYMTSAQEQRQSRANLFNLFWQNQAVSFRQFFENLIKIFTRSQEVNDQIFDKVIFITLIIFTISAFTYLLLKILGITSKKNKRAGTNSYMCQNVVRYANSGTSIPLDDCNNKTVINNYISDSYCADAILEKYQKKRINPKLNTYGAITGAIRESINTKIETEDGPELLCGINDTTYITKNYKINGSDYNMCDLINSIRGTSVPCAPAETLDTDAIIT